MAEDWLADVRKYAADADEKVVAAIVKYCGISLQSRDSSLVAMSDKKERELVRENYLKKKLGLVHPDSDLDEAVIAVGQRMKEDRTKNRVTVYYLLAEHFGLLSLFGGASGGASAEPLAAAGLAAAATAAAATPTPDPVPDPIPAAAAPLPDPVPVAPAPAAEQVAAYSSYDDGDDSGGGGLGWLKWLLLAALLALLLFFLLRYCSGQEAAAPVAEPDAAVAGETADAADASNTAVAGTSATEAEPAPPQGAGVVAGEIGGRPKLTVYFDTGKSAVTNDLATASAKLKDYMAKNPAAKIAVSGYNDPSGNAALNAELSKKRAQGVAKALEAAGIAATAINLEKPAATTDAAASAAEARRVEVVVKP
jgi:outer membrane protein OmpA-like peptidoglycan-associated protein